MKTWTVRGLGAALVAMWVVSCAPVGDNGAEAAALSTAGLRSGDSAINRNNIDSLLNVPRERPGLATGWGKERKSELSSRVFVRTSARPTGVDQIYYNNPEGIRAMAGNPRSVEPMQSAAGGLVEWGIKGRVGYLPAYKEWGQGRRLVAGEKGRNYSIVVKNRCNSSLEIVASVDGLDVQDGKPAAFSKRGYLIAPGDTLEIEGFRTSYSRVAAFEFSSVDRSYANMRHGDTRNVGVIGVAVFTQKGVDPWKWSSREVDTRRSARAFATAP